MKTAPSFAAAPFGELETTQPYTPEQIETIAQGLLSRLTLDEKIKMMSGDTHFWPGIVEMMGGGYNAHPWVAG